MNLNQLLIQAAKDGDNDKVQALIKAGANVTLVQTEGYALSWAAHFGHYEVCETLIHNGAPVNKTNGFGQTALREASAKGHENVVRLLLQNVADPNEGIKGYDTPLIGAIQSGHTGIVTRLLKHGARANVMGSDKKTPLDHACELGRKNMVPILLQHGAINSKQSSNWARNKGYNAIADILEANERDSFGRHALYNAAVGGQYDLCVALLKKGALVNLNRDGLFSPLSGACETGNVRIVQLLLDKSARINDTNVTHPLYLAALGRHTDVLILLLEYDIEVNVKVDGDTPLLVASRQGHEDIVWHLLEHGADLDVKFYNGSTALHYACLYGHEAIVSLLIGHGANVDDTTEDTQTPLHLACERGRKEIVLRLLRAGVNLNIKNISNETPKDLARRYGHHEIVVMINKFVLIRGDVSSKITITSKDNKQKQVVKSVNKGQSVVHQDAVDPNNEDNEVIDPASVDREGMVNEDHTEHMEVVGKASTGACGVAGSDGPVTLLQSNIDQEPNSLSDIEELKSKVDFLMGFILETNDLELEMKTAACAKNKIESIKRFREISVGYLEERSIQSGTEETKEIA